MKLSDKINMRLHPLMVRRTMGAYRREMAMIKRRHPENFLVTDLKLSKQHFELWRRFDDGLTDDWLRLLSGITGSPDAHFVPSTVYYGVLERVLNNCNRSSCGIEDKNLMSLYVPRENRAFCVLRYAQGCFFDDAFNPLSSVGAKELLANYSGDVVGKVAEGSSGGHSVELFRNDIGGRKIGKRHELTIDWIRENVNTYVVQERLEQDLNVARFNSSSVNTCRIMTYRRPWDGIVKVGASMLRIGCGDDIVDNISSGGVSVGVFSDGRLAPRGFDHGYGIVDRHPGSKLRLADAYVPHFERMCDLVINIARKVIDFNLLGFDVIVRKDGRPCIVEVNGTSLCAIEVQQSGAMFGVDTEEMSTWCASHLRYDSFQHFRTFY